MQQAQEDVAVLGRHHAHHADEVEPLLRWATAEHAQAFGRDGETARDLAVPFEAAHAGQVLGAGELYLAALQLWRVRSCAAGSAGGRPAGSIAWT